MAPPPEAMERIISTAAEELMGDTVRALTRGAVTSSIEGQEHAAATLGIELNFKLVNSYAMKKAADYRNLLIEKGGSVINGEFKPWLTDMIKADRQTVTDIVTGALEKGGDSLRNIRKDLDAVFTQGEHNSALVAYQETRRLLNDGTNQRWTDEGIEEAIFHHLDPQLDPRPEHQAMDGRRVQINDPAIQAMLNDYNCHCWLEPVIPGMAGA